MIIDSKIFSKHSRQPINLKKNNIKKDIRLGVNIDHVATLRNARKENFPSPVKAAELALQSGADSITAHLREDRRHIKDNDMPSILS